MALLTRPANVQKNVAATFVLDLVELAGLSAVPTGYYKNTSNWKNVFIKVTHPSGQKNIIQFTMPSTEGTLLVSDTARAGTWEVEQILIRDFDRGEIVIDKTNIPSQTSFNFNVVSAATHGDLLVLAGQTVSIPANGKRQYGDVIVESGGTLQIADGGGILELDVLGNCIINGTILGKQGKHTGGTWSTTTTLAESISHSITQKAGGAGGEGEGLQVIYFTGTALRHNENFLYVEGLSAEVAVGQKLLMNSVVYTITERPAGSSGNLAINPRHEFSDLSSASIQIYSGGTGGVTSVREPASGFAYNDSDNYTYWSESLNPQDDYLAIYFNSTYIYDGTISALSPSQYSPGEYTDIDGTKYYKGVDQSNFQGSYNLYRVTPGASNAGGTGGSAAFGNGGGGGRSAKFTALNGGGAIDVTAGIGAGASTGANAYGQTGAHSTIPSQAAGGGFRGAHGQAIYIKANKIQGTGTIDVSGQKGGDGGAGGEFLSEGELYANGSGGGAAGGEGGKVWLRAKKGTPALTINFLGGERGARGTSSPGALEAEHGAAGSNGSYSFTNY